MGDGFVGQGIPDDADVPDSPDDVQVPADDDQADVDGDSQADDVSADAADDVDDGDVPSDGDDDGTGDEGTSPEYDALLKKYGGDKEKMAQAYRDQSNSMSDMDGRLRSLEQFVQGAKEQDVPKVSPEEMKQRIADSPDVVEVSEELASIDGDITSEQENFGQIVKDLGKAEKEVSKLEGKLEASFDEARPPIAAELASARAKHDRLLDKFKDSDRNIKKLSANFKRIQRRMEKTERSARTEIDREVKQQRDDTTSAQTVRAEFARAMIDEAKTREITTDSKQFKILFDSVQSRLWAYTQTLPEDADPINIEMAVKALTKEYFDEGFGGKASFQAKSRNKRRAATPRADTPQRQSNSDRAPTKGKGTVKDAGWWDRRAKQLLGG